MKILVLDNYDSFTYNLVHLIRELGYGEQMDIFRNDAIDLDAVADYDKILLSPGPGVPSEGGIMPELIRRYAPDKHILGVCLGHQAIAEAFGGQLYNLSRVLHGVSTQVHVLDERDPLFAGVPKSFKIGRYHSWAVKPASLNGQLDLLAVDDDGEVMALRHVTHCVYGVQFHPESVITDHGKQMLQNWLEIPLKKPVSPPKPTLAMPATPPLPPTADGSSHRTPPASAMRDVLNHLFNHQNLTQADAKEILTNIAKGGIYNPSQVAAFLTVFIMRGITVEELSGFREAMLELCIPVDLAEYDPMDLCGTGGDGKDTFNISTLASFVAAGAGVPVVKHGNYGVSSVSGSSNVIEYLGGKFTHDYDTLRRQMDRAGLCFLHAPLFHPAMKNVGPIRRELGVKTFFNMLGPMVNPAFPNKQLVGVFSLELARLYGYLYQQTGKRFTILHSLDGYDEVSLTGPCKYLDNDGDHMMTPEELGLRQLTPAELSGGRTVEDAARIFMSVLDNQATEAQTNAVLANAGMAIRTHRGEMSLPDAVEVARESLVTGRARASLEAFLNV
jgi:anthranilate phosphoribosyltransferase